jgi:hypothetical protein
MPATRLRHLADLQRSTNTPQRAKEIRLLQGTNALGGCAELLNLNKHAPNC